MPQIHVVSQLGSLPFIGETICGYWLSSLISSIFQAVSSTGGSFATNLSSENGYTDYSKTQVFVTRLVAVLRRYRDESSVTLAHLPGADEIVKIPDRRNPHYSILAETTPSKEGGTSGISPIPHDTPAYYSSISEPTANTFHPMVALSCHG